MSVATCEPHQSNRPKVEAILGVWCPKCGAAPGSWCDRSGERLSGLAGIRRGCGTPPSHTERMWSRQGHDPSEFPALREKLKPFGTVKAKVSGTNDHVDAAGVSRAEFARLSRTLAVDLYREGHSACVVALLLGLTRSGTERKIKRAGGGGNQWCRIHDKYERL